METQPSELENLFVETVGKMAESISVNRVVGQLYALLYIRPNPVSLDEMAECLKISKGSVSIHIRILEDWNAVKKVWVHGSRKDFYTAEPDFMKIFSERLQQGISRRLTYADERIQQMNALISSGKQVNGKNKELKIFYQNRFKQLQETKELLESILKFLPKISRLKNLKTLISLLRY